MVKKIAKSKFIFIYSLLILLMTQGLFAQKMAGCVSDAEWTCIDNPSDVDAVKEQIMRAVQSYYAGHSKANSSAERLKIDEGFDVETRRLDQLWQEEFLTRHEKLRAAVLKQQTTALEEPLQLLRIDALAKKRDQLNAIKVLQRSLLQERQKAFSNIHHLVLMISEQNTPESRLDTWNSSIYTMGKAALRIESESLGLLNNSAEPAGRFLVDLRYDEALEDVTDQQSPKQFYIAQFKVFPYGNLAKNRLLVINQKTIANQLTRSNYRTILSQNRLIANSRVMQWVEKRLDEIDQHAKYTSNVEDKIKTDWDKSTTELQQKYEQLSDEVKSLEASIATTPSKVETDQMVNGLYNSYWQQLGQWQVWVRQKESESREINEAEQEYFPALAAKNYIAAIKHLPRSLQSFQIDPTGEISLVANDFIPIPVAFKILYLSLKNIENRIFHVVSIGYKFDLKAVEKTEVFDLPKRLVPIPFAQPANVAPMIVISGDSYPNQIFGNTGKSVAYRAFKIDQFEVKVRQYEKCVKLGKCGKPLTCLDGCTWDDSRFVDHPVNGITWKDATDYCQFVGKRLPTELEWGRAAQFLNQTAYRYPTGQDSISCKTVVMQSDAQGCGFKGPTQVGTRAREINGTYDMAGNVSEWVADEANFNPTFEKKGTSDQNTQQRVVRGGNWMLTNPTYFQGNSRIMYKESDRFTTVGFRCAASLE